MKNKRGVMGIIIFFLMLFTIIIVGFIAAFVVSLGTYTSDQITTVMEGIGNMGAANATIVVDSTFGTFDKFVQATPWLVAFAYVCMLIFSIVFVIAWRYNPNPMFMGFYFMLVVLLVFGCIIISNMYQNIYTGSNIVAQGLQAQTALSWMILYSPLVMTIIAFIVGIYIFAGKQTEFQGGVV